MASPGPLVLVACDYVRRAMAEGIFAQGKYLPPLSRLAKMAGVGGRTMWKALHILREEGAVAGAKGHPFLALPLSGGTGTHSTAGGEYQPRTKSQRVAAAIEEEILNAGFPTGGIPAIKELKARYGCSYPTIRKALDSLRGKEVIVPVPGGYAVAPLPAVHSHSRLVFIGYSWETGEIVLSPNDLQILRMLDLECSKAKLRLDVIYFSMPDSGCTFTNAATGARYDVRAAEDILGYIYLVTGQSSFREEVLSSTWHTKKPVAVVDQFGGVAIPRFYMRNPLLKIFRTSSSNRPAALIARHLRGLGHRSIGYISPFHQAFWSKARLEGLRESLQRPGSRSRVVPFTIDSASTPTDFFEDALRRCDTGPLRAYYEKMRERLPPAFSGPIDSTKFNDHLKVQLSLCEASFRCEELFERALADRRLTAWVCANDLVALLAQQYLRRRDFRIPRDLSLVGIDDSADALKSGLTSYNFNLPGVVQRVLDFLLRKDRGMPSKTIVELDGVLSLRQSTGPARK